MTLELTPTKQLRTGRSVWSDTRHPPVTGATPHKHLKCDVAVVGAGISGAFMAEKLAGLYGQVVLVDRRAPAMGSTHASTAMLQYEIDTPLTELADKIGHRAAVQAWRLSRDMTAKLIAYVRAARISCDLTDRRSLYLTGDALGARGMKAEARARKRAGLDCEFLPAAALRSSFGIDRTGAILSDGAAVADPVALARGLLRRACRKGAKLYFPCDIQGVLANRSGVVLDCGSCFIEAKVAVFCTGYEAICGLPKGGTTITSSWAAATSPDTDLPHWLHDTVVWEAAEPYLYMRTDSHGRLIVGGEDADLDSPVYRARTLGMKAKKLAAKTQSLLGVPAKWTHTWAGAFGESTDGLPIIDAIPDMPNCFTVMGFGGNGTIYSFIAAQLMPGLLRGRPLASAGLFQFR